MDRLIDAVAEYLCRHRGVGLFRLTLDLTRRRLAEIRAVEVVRGAAAPTGASHRDVVGRRQAVYAFRKRGLVQHVRETVNWTGLLTSFTYAPKPGVSTAKNGVLSPSFLPLPLLRGAEEWRVDFTQRRVK